MRYQITKRSSTKPERIVYEVLKELHIPFKHRWLIEGHEVDFLIFDKVVLEINGHDQVGERNHLLADLGFTPIHLRNSDVTRESVKQLLTKI